MTDSSQRLEAALSDRYAIERELGAGGMATVYLAKDLKHNRKVALKVLKPELAAVVGAERFLREVEVTANLQHPHILPLFESGEADGFLFYVMPYVEGESLRGLVSRERALPVAEATRLMRDVADALAYAHSRGVVHRDIKPDNVMVSGRHATVTDFGVARAVSEAAGREALTTVGMAVGTPAYMAPEQATADPAIDHRADIYAFGVLAYELLTGAPPFADRTPQQILAAHVTEAPKPLGEVRPEVGKGLADVVMRCLAKEPGDRWATAEEIVQRLEALATPEGGTMAVRAVAKPRRLVVGLVTAVAAVAAILFAVLRDGAAPPADVSPSAVAVFPFAVRGGDEVQYLGEGMVNLLAASMDGAGDLRSVDPRAVMAQVRQEELGGIAPDQAARIARHLGAGLFILGDIVQVGERLRIDAALYDERRGSEPVGTGTVDGEPDNLLGMVDRVASHLLASGAIGGGSRVTQVAAVTTSSLAALKLYLEGESAFREGRFDPAVQAFQSAIAADSQFALAFYRLSIAAEWALRPDVAEPAAAGAVRHTERLSDRDRRLLEGLLAHRRGEAREAERIFRAVVSIWPQDVEAWFQLGEVQFHYGPLLGEPATRSREAFERALALEPDNATALIHVLRLAARAGDAIAVDSISVRLAALIPEGDRALEVAMLGALVPPDSAALEELRARLMRAPDVVAVQATFNAPVWTDEFAVIRPLVEASMPPTRADPVRALGHVQLAYLDLLRGRWERARQELAAAASLNPALALEHRALLVLQPFLPASREEIEALRDELRAWDAARVPPSPLPSGYFAAHDELHAGLRLYLLGLANARLGAPAATVALADQLAGMRGGESALLVYRGLADGLRAAAAEARGDLRAAARLLEGVEHVGNYEAALFSPFRTRVADRYRRAVLLDSLGQAAEAARVYGSFERFSLFDNVFAAPAHLRAGRLAEREGRLADARRHYERFLLLWAAADPAFQPLLEEVRAALARVGGDEGP